MARLLFPAAVLVFFSVASAFAQEDSTRYSTLPVSEEDTAQVLQNDIEPENTLTAVPVNELPAKLRDVLEKEEQYRGWRDSTIYFQKNTGLYLVPVKHEEGVRLFGMNEHGHPVTFNEIIITRGQ